MGPHSRSAMPKPEDKFRKQHPAFWAHVKLISENLGYSKSGKLKRYTTSEILACLESQSVATSHLYKESKLTDQGILLKRYLDYRAQLLEDVVRVNLMDKEAARKLFEETCGKYNPKCKLPMNKQKGEKRHPAYLTGVVNTLTEAFLKGQSFDDEPRNLIRITRESAVLRTLSRWMDGAYPSTRNPIAVWEVKEYYGTKTFGSRVADGVYETMLDGFEFQELHEHEGIHVQHYLIVDDYYTWWDCGKSYLCRIVDMMHMGLVDEVLFGREVVKRWPEIVTSWITK